MILPDVNVLVYAFREDAKDHRLYRKWLLDRIESSEAFALSELVLSGVLRVLTHPRAFNPPTPVDLAIAYCDALRSQPNAVIVSPGDRHWEIFSALCTRSRAKGNIIPDAYHAALAIEHGCEWVTTDGDFARFDGLRWSHPIER